MRGSKIVRVAGAALVLGALGAPQAVAAQGAQVALSAARGAWSEVRSLVGGGADVNAAQGDGMTALHWAAMAGDAETTALLLRAGANAAATTRLGAYTPLHVASANGRAEVARLLLGVSDLAALTSTGVSALHLAADAGNPELVQALIAGGADVNATEAYAQRTPLMFAAARGRTEAVRALIAAGAELTATTRVVDYPARSAEGRADRQARERRLALERGEVPEGNAPAGRGGGAGNASSAGGGASSAVGGGGAGGGAAPASRPASPAPARAMSYDDLVGRQGGFSALHYAARDGHADVVRALLNAGMDIDERTAGDRSTPMLIATINGNFDLARELLERGADPNLASEDGVAPLFATINNEWALRTWYPQPTASKQQRTSYLDLMRALLEAGANPDARLAQHLWYSAYNAGRMGVEFDGATAFWRAAYATDVEAMRLLVTFGADPHIPTVKPPGGGGGAQDDPSGLPPVAPGEPATYAIHAATGVGYGTSRVGQQHRHVPGGWLPAVKYLVEELGADVNVRDHEGFSAVHHAASRGDNEVILFLVQHGADVTFVSRRGQTTVDMANGPQQRVQPFPSTIALLESLGAKNNHRCQSC